jgi:glycosyltransferase involved in cell wall biosynthesis
LSRAKGPAESPVATGVLVLGMHRSGTSAVAGALAAAGFHLGSDEDLAPGLPQNPQGFFEHAGIVAFDDRLLADLGWTWDTPDPLLLSRPPLLTQRVEEGRALVRSQLIGPRPWATKDPRISVLLPWWRRILLDRFVSIVCVRRPEEVAWSLAVIYGFPPELGLALWATYHRHLAAGLEGLPVIGLDYGALTEDPSTVLSQLFGLLDKLGVNGQFDIPAAIASIKPELRRATQPSWTNPGGPLSSTLEQSYKLWSGEPVWLKERLSISQPPAEGWERALLETHRRAREEERLRTAIADEGRKQAGQLSTVELERDSLIASGAALSAQAEGLTVRLAGTQAERDALSVAGAALRGQADALAAQLRGEQSERDRLAKQLDEATAERDGLSVASAELRNHADVLAVQLGAAEAERDNRGVQLDARLSDIDSLNARVGELQNELAGSREREGVGGSLRMLNRSVRTGARRVRHLLRRILIKLLPAKAVGFVWRNPLFDREWYLTRYPDVRRHNMDAERHYRRHGVRERRNPNALFETAWYLATYPDVAANGINPLDHYLLFGAGEGRDPSSHFDTDWYLARNPDVRQSGINPLIHYLHNGSAEGRPPHPGNDGQGPSRGGNVLGGDELMPFDSFIAGRLLLVVHDAHNHGAQQTALHLAKALTERFHFGLDIVLLGDGALWSEFERYGRVHDFASKSVTLADQAHQLRQLRATGIDVALCNSTASGRLVPAMKAAGFRVVSLVHELPELIRDYGLESSAKALAEQSDAVVFASDFVRRGFETVAGDIGPRAHIRAQGLYRTPDDTDRAEARATVRRELGLDRDDRIVLAVGYADLRKGFDLFVPCLTAVRAARQNVAFVWLGCEDPALISAATREAQGVGLSSALRLLPRVPAVNRYYEAADVMVLPSREDPFPSVVLEALSHGLPVVAFEGATGAGELIARGCGVLVPPLDVKSMSDVVIRLLDEPKTARRLGATGRQIVEKEFDWFEYVLYLLDLGGHRFRGVSVVVPNYNYARHLPRRLQSIFEQVYPIREVIVMDDASTDESLSVLDTLKREHAWVFTVVRSEENSGSVFRQWLRGVARARGDLVWIAEADDFAERDFLSRLVPTFDNRRVLMAYSESRQIDEEGVVIAPDYLDYVRDIDPLKWTRSWTRPGLDELAESFAIRNTIPNVSAVVFERRALLEALEPNIEPVSALRVAGDFAVYVNMLLTGGHLTFVAEPLNNHRRHARSVTTASYGEVVVTEIAQLQRLVHESVPVRPEVRDHAMQYLWQLCAQFELSPAFAATLGIEARVPAPVAG